MTETTSAVVTGAFGTRMRLRLADGRSVDARIKGRRLRPVCGDRVTAAALENESDWLITAIAPRDNELTRPNLRGRTEILAANLDYLAVVCANLPQPDWYVVDRYLCAAELMRIAACVVYNKVDDGEPDEEAGRELADYRAAGYVTVACSARTGLGLDALAAALAGHTAIITGQSGVGKSSLIAALTATELRTAEVSDSSGEGRHTTVNPVMLPLPGGGQVVDSPGVRDYAPYVDEPADVEFGFREIHALGGGCRFADCRHRREPDCEVKAALADGRLAARRYESYRRLLLLTEQQRQRSARRPAE